VEEAIPHGVSHSSSKRPTGRIVQRQFSGILHLGETFSLTGTLPCSSRCRAASLKKKPRATAPKLIPSIFVHLWLTHVPESLSRTRQPQGTNLPMASQPQLFCSSRLLLYPLLKIEGAGSKISSFLQLHLSTKLGRLGLPQFQPLCKRAKVPVVLPKGTVGVNLVIGP